MCSSHQPSYYRQPRFKDRGYLRTVYFRCHNYVLIVDILPRSKGFKFWQISTGYTILLLETTVAKLHDMFDYDQSVFLAVFEPCTVFLFGSVIAPCYLYKHVSVTFFFSESPLNADNTETMTCPFGVRINWVPLNVEFNFVK